MMQGKYLKEGYVVVTVEARCRNTPGGRGKVTVTLVDLKAGIRYLRRHRNELPGDYDRIITVGTSADGAIGSLLGCTGDSADYLPNLEEISTVMDESDAIFGAQCPCPIIDLDHSDMAYEWLFGAKDSYFAPFSLVSRQLTPLQKALSRVFAAEYPANVNSLDLALTLGEDGPSRNYY